MSNKLFVGNLSWSTTDDSMKDFFATIGEVVSSRVVLERETRRSRGFGFVEMASAELAEKAVAELNEKDLDGRNIRVSVAMDRPEGDRN
jgi:cold-inducible RNA-binding protein